MSRSLYVFLQAIYGNKHVVLGPKNNVESSESVSLDDIEQMTTVGDGRYRLRVKEGREFQDPWRRWLETTESNRHVEKKAAHGEAYGVGPIKLREAIQTAEAEVAVTDTIRSQASEIRRNIISSFQRGICTRSQADDRLRKVGQKYLSDAECDPLLYDHNGDPKNQASPLGSMLVQAMKNVDENSKEG